ncbi:MAG TPA: hypothetical protein PLU39_18955 [Armatimonadota bacterium]|jgi:uncharacterized membrane protein|nr:hypothetical protein [Armatimonadota bacterium]HOJ20534.1 hypothetical protein [Armatimonadota bacterium]HOM82378.1 hypothetical protein [Armatimonadota bacterium]HPO73445.1 hypothetical protein [Armatimonadota bacterium]HPT99949.1 hypothetical protein [Armatimonadota bacterium]
MPLIMRWLHIGAAITSVGGLFLLVSVILPSLRAADPEQATLLLRGALRRLWPALWILGAALLLSGFYAAALVRPSMTPTYHLVLGIKLLLSLAFLGTALVAIRPASDAPERLARRLDWARLALIFGVAAVLLSSYLWHLRVG